MLTDNYTKLCTIDINLSQIPVKQCAKENGTGIYFAVEYDIVLIFGLTELKVQVAWLDHNVSFYDLHFAVGE